MTSFRTAARAKAEPALQALERETLLQKVHLQLKNALFAGRFEPGSRLVLRDLADMFETSITPVRDALTQLVANGTLERDSRNTAMVPELSATNLKHLIITRTALEGRAAREAALRASEDDINTLEIRLRKMRELIASKRLDAYLDLHREFHFSIYAVSQIPILFEMIENLWLRCGPTLSYVVPDYVQLLKGTDHHARVLDSLARHDAVTAEREIVADIESAGQYVLSLADADGWIRPPVSAI